MILSYNIEQAFTEMNQSWMDSLSEEWISQPGSSVPVSLKGSPTPSPGNASHSRIPRLKSRSVSASSLVKTENSNGNVFAINNDEGALRERTASDLNTPQRRLPKPCSKFDEQHQSIPRPNHSRQTSTGSVSLTPQGTVQYRNAQTSLANGERQKAPPDWRRRAFEGIPKPGLQRDLFSPMGLEHVFQQRSIRKNPPKQKGQRYEATEADCFPSSPPPYSVPIQKTSRPAGKVTDTKSIQNQNPVTRKAPDDYARQDVVLPSAPSGLDINDSLRNENSTKSRQSSTHKNSSIDSQREERSFSPLTAYQVNSANSRQHSPKSESLKDQSRIISTHSELRHEIISPVSLPRLAFSRRTAKSSIKLSGNQSKPDLQGSTNDLSNLPLSPSSDHGTYGRTNCISTREEYMKDLTSHSLPDDLSVGTEVFVANGGFVNTRRGGYSTDGSFQRKPLSPSIPPSDALLEGSSLAVPCGQPQKRQTSIRNLGRKKQDDAPLNAENPPKTPVRAQPQGQSSPDRLRSSGSPLKLFDKYDTYTNDRLLRRMSQFEGSHHEMSSDLDSDNENLVSSTAAHPLPSPQLPQNIPSVNTLPRSPQRISSFGEGKLDKFGFSHRALPRSGHEPKDQERPRSPAQEQLNDQIFSIPQSALSSTSTQTNTESLKIHRTKLSSRKRSAHYDKLETDIRCETVDLVTGQIPQLVGSTANEKTGKRLLNSPGKNSQAKRRRTIFVRDDKPLNVDDHLLVEAVLPIPSVSIIGKKRKDARYENNNHAADPNILAKRNMLRPRTLTFNLTRSGSGSKATTKESQSKADYVSEMNEEFDYSMVKDLPAPTVDQSTHILAGELATFALDVAQDIATGARKTSVTTADFFNEANLIMQHIRAKEQSQNNNTDNHSDVDPLENIEESSHEGSTKEPLSRPPSREGGSLRRLREPKQLNPRVVSHLRKYEDKSDIDVGLSTSTKLLNVAVETLEPVESEPPNIRIRNGQQHKGSRRLETEAQASNDQPSSSSSSRGSIPSGSSSSSGNKATIQPQKISHLISDHVAGMTFDRVRQMWIKKKTSDAKGGHSEDHLSEFTEEDPLGEIPDLSVDELEELNRIKAGHLESSPPQVNGIDIVEGSPRSSSSESECYNHDPHLSSPKPFDADKGQQSSQSGSHLDSLHAEKLTDSQSEQDIPPAGAALALGEAYIPSTTNLVSHAEDVEHEISILEGRNDRTPMQSKDRSRRARVVTVAFSSPIIDYIHENASYDEPLEDWEQEDDLDLEFSRDYARLQKASNVAAAHNTPGYKQTSSFRRAGRKASIVTRSYLTRPVSRIDEQEELVFLNKHGMSNNVSREIVLTTPQQPLSIRQNVVSRPSTSPGERSDLSLHLTPLPNFSIHQIDEVVDQTSKNVRKRRSRLSDEVARRPFDLSVKEIVKKITDIEPYEPYWESIRKLNLHNKELLTLHELKEFCDRIEELNVSDNELGQLDGTPSGVRMLNARGNCLSSLTDWSHLQNLQYLDISENQLQDLYGFRALWHLRDIRADNNQIEDLDGIRDLDGLLKLSLRHNNIKALRLKGANL